MVSGSNSIGVRLRESFFFPLFIAECSHRFLMVGLSSVEPPLEGESDQERLSDRLRRKVRGKLVRLVTRETSLSQKPFEAVIVST